MNIKNPDLKVNSLIIIDSTQVTTDANSEGASDQNSVNTKNKNDIETNTSNISSNTSNINQKINQLTLSDKTGKDLNLAYFGLKTDEAGNSTIIVTKSEASDNKLDKSIDIPDVDGVTTNHGEIVILDTDDNNYETKMKLFLTNKNDEGNVVKGGELVFSLNKSDDTVSLTFFPITGVNTTVKVEGDNQFAHKKYVDSHTLNSFNNVNVLNPDYFTTSSNGIYPTNFNNGNLNTASKYAVDAINELKSRIDTLEGTTKDQKLEIKKLRSLLNEKIR